MSRILQEESEPPHKNREQQLFTFFGTLFIMHFI